MNLPLLSRAMLILVSSLASASGAIAADRDPENSASAEGFAWISSFEGTRSAVCTAIASRKGGAVIAGQFAGPLASSVTRPLQNAGRNDGFVAAISDSGKVLWQIAVGGAGNDQFRAIATDSDGHTYVTGFVTGNVENDSRTLPASTAGADAYLVKLSANGETLWSRRLAGPSADSGEAVVIADDGTVFWGGHFQGSARLLDDAEIPVISSGGSTDAFVAAFDPQGNAKWLQSFGGKQADEVTGLAADGHGGIFVTGSYESLFPLRRETGIDFLRAKGGTDAFLMHLDGEGKIDWARSISGPQQEHSVALALDGDQLLLAGNFQNKLQVNATTTLESAGVFDGFVSAWSIQGDLAWARRFGGPDAVTVQALHVGTDEINVVGSFQGKLEFGRDASIAAISSATVTPFIAAIETNGSWRRAAVGAYGENADLLGVTMSATGDSLVCGVSEGELTANGKSRPDDKKPRQLAMEEGAVLEESQLPGTNDEGPSAAEMKMAAYKAKKKRTRSVAFVAKLRK